MKPIFESLELLIFGDIENIPNVSVSIKLFVALRNITNGYTEMET